MRLQLLAPVLLLVACDGAPSDPATDDSPTYGTVLILADQDLKPLLDDQERMFEATYDDAALEIRYLPERKLLTAMLNDSVRAVFGYFRPGGEQDGYFRKRNMVPHVEVVATDAIAIVAAKNSPVDSLPLDTLRLLLSGEDGSRKALFDDPSGGVVRSLVDSLFQGNASLLKNAVAVNSAEELMTRVAHDTATIGLLSFSRISDLDDPSHRALRDSVKLLRISDSPNVPALLPTQGTLADGRYPLRRSVYMLVTEGKSGLGTGFASFVAGHKGQRIILKQGIAPAHVPAREVMIVTQ